MIAGDGGIGFHESGTIGDIDVEEVDLAVGLCDCAVGGD